MAEAHGMNCLLFCLLYDWYTPRFTKCFTTFRPFTPWRFSCRRGRGCSTRSMIFTLCRFSPIQPRHPHGEGQSWSSRCRNTSDTPVLLCPEGFKRIYWDHLHSLDRFLTARGPVRLELEQASPTPCQTFCRRSGPPINVTRDYRCCQTPSVGWEDLKVWFPRLPVP